MSNEAVSQIRLLLLVILSGWMDKWLDGRMGRWIDDRWRPGSGCAGEGELQGGFERGSGSSQ